MRTKEDMIAILISRTVLLHHSLKIQTNDEYDGLIQKHYLFNSKIITEPLQGRAFKLFTTCLINLSLLSFQNRSVKSLLESKPHMYERISNGHKCINSVEVEATPELLCSINLRIDEDFPIYE